MRFPLLNAKTFTTKVAWIYAQKLHLAFRAVSAVLHWMQSVYDLPLLKPLTKFDLFFNWTAEHFTQWEGIISHSETLQLNTVCFYDNWTVSDLAEILP